MSAVGILAKDQGLMIALLLGTACGTGELLLLKVLVNKITNAEALPLWIIPAKLGVLAFFLIPCALLWPQDLLWAAAGTGGSLVIGALVVFISSGNKPRGATEGSRKPPGQVDE